MTRVRLFGWALGVLVVLAIMLVLVGCHKHSTQVLVQPVPDYTVDSVNADVVYDPDATVICMGGRSGYYDHYRVFHPLVVVGGFEGYYDSNHRFVSSAPGVRMRVQSQVRVVPPARVVGPSPAVAVPRPVPVASRPVPVAPRVAPSYRPASGGGGRRK
jgi:hypothetical protein